MGLSISTFLYRLNAYGLAYGLPRDHDRDRLLDCAADDCVYDRGYGHDCDHDRVDKAPMRLLYQVQTMPGIQALPTLWLVHPHSTHDH